MKTCLDVSLDLDLESWPEWDLNPRPLDSLQML